MRLVAGLVSDLTAFDPEDFGSIFAKELI